MQPDAVTHAGFYRMAERVAKVERSALSLFGLVGSDDLRLVDATAFDTMG